MVLSYLVGPDDLPNVEKRVGLYINVAPLHSVMQPGSTIDVWLQNLQLEQVASRLYQYTPLSDIQAWTGVKGDFFDTLMVFENYPVSKVIASEKWSLQVEKVRVLEQTNYPLTIIIVASGEKISIHFSYNTRLLSGEYIQEISGHFENVLSQVIANADRTLSEIKLTSAAEEKQLLENFNGKTVNYPTEKSIIDLFETQVAKTPGAAALLFEEESMSFDTLNKKANQFAHYLLSKGAKKETLIPICIDRGMDMLVAILAVLKQVQPMYQLIPSTLQKELILCLKM
jgi:non-ribosomal peptide synthetase component F